jgi:hypothetical protein
VAKGTSRGASSVRCRARPIEAKLSKNIASGVLGIDRNERRA